MITQKQIERVARALTPYPIVAWRTDAQGSLVILINAIGQKFTLPSEAIALRPERVKRARDGGETDS